VALALLIGIPLAPIVAQRSLGYVPTISELIDLARTPLALYEAINWQGRELAWPIVFAAFLTSPWTGIGLGGSSVVMREHFPPHVGPLAHNEYLRLMTETGIIGLLLFAAAIVTWLVLVLKADRRTGGTAREFTLPALAGILSWAIISITDNAFDYYAPFTQFVALLVAASLVAARLQQEPAA
jgi:O-antigen ligase